MKKKILLSGKNQAVEDQFFYNLSDSLECQTTSIRTEDLKSHVRYFKPDMFVYCVHDESKEVMKHLGEVFIMLRTQGIYCGIIGEDELCERFVRESTVQPDVVFVRPLTSSVIISKIDRFFENQIDKEVQIWAEEQLKEEKKSRKHVTVIDDDSRMLKLIKEYLHDSYDVATALNGKIALKFLESKHTDIILLDYVMPDDDGPDVYRKIRNLDGYKDTPIIFLTGMSEKEKIQKVMELMPQGYLLKPVEKDRLLKTIKEHVE